MQLVHGGDTQGYFEKYGKEPLDFSANTSPLGMPLGVKNAIIDSLEFADKYPDPLCRQLKVAISKKEGVPCGKIVCANGAADLIHRLMQLLKPKTVLTLAPSFFEYEQAANEAGSQVLWHFLKRENNFALDNTILDSITLGIEAVFICQPNNPTGQIASRQLVYDIAKKCQEVGALLLVDECFLEFLPNWKDITMISYLENMQNVIVLKAFTKLYGMAGVRLGYGLCADEKLANSLQSYGQPWAVSSLAQAAGIAALNETEYVQNVLKIVEKERAFLLESLEKLPVEVLGAGANYIFFYCGKQNFFEDMQENGILIRNCKNYQGLGEGYYRVAIKNNSENCRLIEAMNIVGE